MDKTSLYTQSTCPTGTAFTFQEADVAGFGTRVSGELVDDGRMCRDVAVAACDGLVIEEHVDGTGAWH